jgi:hypothetical protein
MTLLAPFNQQRSNLLFKEFDVRLSRSRYGVIGQCTRSVPLRQKKGIGEHSSEQPWRGGT